MRFCYVIVLPGLDALAVPFLSLAVGIKRVGFAPMDFDIVRFDPEITGGVNFHVAVVGELDERAGLVDTPPLARRDR